MKSLKVGHYTSLEHGTGTSVFLFDQPATGTYLICGSAPATREVHTMELDSIITNIDGLALTGGSAFGLGVVDGVMQYLLEKDQGKLMPHGRVPIVPAAAIYDLAVKSPISPTAENAYQACLQARPFNDAIGQIGAGTGATVGKLMPHATIMTGGLGYASHTLEKGIIVSAYAVVNAMGDIRDEQGRIIAGAYDKEKKIFSNCENYLLTGHTESYLEFASTTLVAVFTNAKFSKIELKRIAKMAVAGIGRAIFPSFTLYDGDIIFCFSLGEEDAVSEVMIGTIATEMVRQAIVSAVKTAVIFEP